MDSTNKVGTLIHRTRLHIWLLVWTAILFVAALALALTQWRSAEPTFRYLSSTFEATPAAVCPGDTLTIKVGVRFDGRGAFTVTGGTLRRDGDYVPAYRGYPATVSPNAPSPAGDMWFAYPIVVPSLPAGDYWYTHAAQQFRSHAQTYEAPFTIKDCGQ